MATFDLVANFIGNDELSRTVDGIQGSVASLGAAAAATTAAAGVAAAGAIAGVAVAATAFANEAQMAQAKLRTQFNLTEEEAASMGDVVVDVFGNNFGDSIEDAAAAVAEVRNQLGPIPDEDLQPITENALALRDAFEVDVAESVSAVDTLMNNFGLSSEEAFAFVTTGMQEGLNASGDFLESITEYSTQFGSAGATADEFFSVMATGMQDGILGTDKAADMFKEWRLRITEADGAIVDTYNNLFALTDLDTEFAGAGGFFEAIESGAISGGEAFDTVLNALENIEDPIQRQQMAVELLGTQFEDLGDAAFDIDALSQSVTDNASSVDALNAQYETLPALFEGVRRRLLVAIQPIGDAILRIANKAMPLLKMAFDAFEKWVVPIINNATDSVIEFVDGIDMDKVASTIKNVASEIKRVAGPIMNFIARTFSLKDVLFAVGAAIMAVALPAIISIGQTLLPIIGVIGAIIGAVTLLKLAWQNDFGGIRTTLTTFWNDSLKPTLLELVSWLQEKVPVAIAALKEWWVNTLQPALQTVSDFVRDNVAPIVGALLSFWLETVKARVRFLASVWSTVLQPALAAVWGFISNSVIPILATLGGAAMEGVKAGAQSVSTFWKNTLKPALDLVWAVIQEDLAPALRNLGEAVMPLVESASKTIADLWNNSLQPALQTVWEWVSDNVLPVLDELASLASGALANAFNMLVDGALGTLISALAELSDLIDIVVGGIGLITNAAAGGVGGLGAPGALGVGALTPQPSPGIAAPVTGGSITNNTYNLTYAGRETSADPGADMLTFAARQGGY